MLLIVDLPPIIDNPKGPLLGILSDTNPIINGQKKQIPIANIPAAMKVKYPTELPSNSSPIKENIADKVSKLIVENLVKKNPALALPIVINPLMNINNNIDGKPTSDNKATIH